MLLIALIIDLCPMVAKPTTLMVFTTEPFGQTGQRGESSGWFDWVHQLSRWTLFLVSAHS